MKPVIDNILNTACCLACCLLSIKLYKDEKD